MLRAHQELAHRTSGGAVFTRRCKARPLTLPTRVSGQA